MLKVRFCSGGRSRAMLSTTIEESTPPERKAPSGTSLTSRSRTASSIRRSSSLAASSSSAKRCLRPNAAARSQYGAGPAVPSGCASRVWAGGSREIPARIGRRV